MERIEGGMGSCDGDEKRASRIRLNKERREMLVQKGTRRGIRIMMM